MTVGSAVDGECGGGDDSGGGSGGGAGEPPDGCADAVAEPHHGLPGLPGAGHRSPHGCHAGPAPLLCPAIPAHPHSEPPPLAADAHTTPKLYWCLKL